MKDIKNCYFLRGGNELRILTRVDLDPTGVPGNLRVKIGFVNDTGSLLVHHVIRRESLTVGTLGGGSRGGEGLVQEISLVQ